MTMRLQSKARDKAALPEGYQFGDMRYYGRIAVRFKRQWDIVAPPVTRRDDWFTTNVIEGEHFASDADRYPVQEGERVE